MLLAAVLHAGMARTAVAESADIGAVGPAEACGCAATAEPRPQHAELERGSGSPVVARHWFWRQSQASPRPASATAASCVVPGCRTKGGLLSRHRRHTCTSCGQSCCGEHSSKELRPTGPPNAKPVRICINCRRDARPERPRPQPVLVPTTAAGSGRVQPVDSMFPASPVRASMLDSRSPTGSFSSTASSSSGLASIADTESDDEDSEDAPMERADDADAFDGVMRGPLVIGQAKLRQDEEPMASGSTDAAPAGMEQRRSRVSFVETVVVGVTHAPPAYDRRGHHMSIHFTASEREAICAELNELKRTMEVHEQSRYMTRFH